MKKAHQQASQWFNSIYEENKERQENIPWAKQKVNPLLQSYLHEDIRHQGEALVIGCGLGDDAYALDKAGYSVTAIDVSSSALEQAKKRFPHSNITFEKQDIFEMPSHYFEYFDFVFEAFTIQSLPREFRKEMIKSITQSIKKEGKILVVAHKHEHIFTGPPWPLTKKEINLFQDEKLKELTHEVIRENSPISTYCFRVLYQKR